MTFEEVKAVSRALVDQGVDFVVIGSMAMAAQDLPRATLDLDLFVAPALDNLEALAYGLRPWRLEAEIRKFGSASEAAEARLKRRPQ